MRWEPERKQLSFFERDLGATSFAFIRGIPA